MNKISYIPTVLIALLTLACQETPQQQPEPEQAVTSEVLPSWNEGAVKTSIIDFVEAVIEEGSPDFVPVEDRIAVFDNDGTLWTEQPAYFQLLFAMDRVKAMAADHPEWETRAPFDAILKGDMRAFAGYGMKGIMEVVMTTHAGMSPEEFEKEVKDWMATARHPKLDKPYNELIFQPMVELLEYLRENDFKTFIVSGGGIEFMRAWAEEAYGIPKDQIVGSSIKTEFVIEDGQPMIKRLPELDFIDDKEGKPVGINRFIGRRPVFCAGNSDGDLQMMQYTAAGPGKSMMLYVHHTDSIREWAYDRDSHIGQFDKGLDEAMEKGWTIINMKDDWEVVYPFELTR